VLPELVGLDDFYLLFWVDLSERQQGYGWRAWWGWRW
jgi:hypothetical protein